MSTSIEWTNETWNPVTGCTKVSPGCANCYAERMAKRLRGMGLPQYQAVVDENGWTGETSLAPSQLDKPIDWREPRMVFVCSMSDLFHESVDVEHIRRVFWTIEQCPAHTFQILTKRPERMLKVLTSRFMNLDLALPARNVWLGVSVENQEAADERIPLLLETPAAVRFVSIEPMLDPVDVRDYMRGLGRFHTSSVLDWVIVGGESGPGARPMHPNWAEGIRDQCVESGTPFFFKQSGRELNGREWNQYPVR